MKWQIGKPNLSVLVRLYCPRPVQDTFSTFMPGSYDTPLIRPTQSASNQCSFGTPKL